jgi:hypothetical protein
VPQVASINTLVVTGGASLVSGGLTVGTVRVFDGAGHLLVGLNDTGTRVNLVVASTLVSSSLLIASTTTASVLTAGYGSITALDASTLTADSLTATSGSITALDVSTLAADQVTAAVLSAGDASLSGNLSLGVGSLSIGTSTASYSLDVQGTTRSTVIGSNFGSVSNVTSSFVDLFAVQEGEMGQLTVLNTNGSNTWAFVMLFFSTLTSTTGLLSLGGNNVSLQYAGSMLQVATGTGTSNLNYSYLRMA